MNSKIFTLCLASLLSVQGYTQASQWWGSCCSRSPEEQEMYARKMERRLVGNALSAIKKKKFAEFRDTLDQIGDINVYEGILLYALAIQGTEEMVEFFLDKEPNINICCATKDFLEPFRLTAVERVAFQNGLAWSPLHAACAQQRNEIAKLLIARGANINAAEKREKLGTPLILAIAQNNLSLVKWLLENGADPNATYTFNKKTIFSALDLATSIDLKDLIHQYGGQYLFFNEEKFAIPKYSTDAAKSAHSLSGYISEQARGEILSMETAFLMIQL